MIGVIPFLPPGYKSDKCLPFLMDGQASLPAAAGSSVVIADTTLQSSYVAAILAFGVTFRTVTEYEYNGNVVFRLLINNSPFLDNNQGTWTTQRGSILQPVPTLIRLPLGAHVTFVATRTSVAAAQAQTIAFLATGMMWPDTNPKTTDAAPFRV